MPEESKKTNWLSFILVIVFVIICVGVLGYLLYNRNKPQPSPGQAVAAANTVGEVAITSTGFSPSTILITKGSSVTWTNKDKSVHQIISDPHPSHSLLPGLDSGSLNFQESFTFTFEKTGKFTYHDENNPLKVLGVVEVK
ncbi:MAG TPA: cupredoxin domain-containing protein [Candidatus Saccharimonadales bacterium]|nr:cupredoxin domain-containing protein [Candidatus Saccharimonadales bacterium]